MAEGPTTALSPWPGGSATSPEPPLILFDAPCVLCQRSVRIIARFDSGRVFRFAALDSVAGRHALAAAGDATCDQPSVVLIDRGVAWRASDAVVHIARRLAWPARMLAWLGLVPRPLRDAIYFAIAVRRMRWFGRAEACALLPPDVRERVIVD